ncbi:hypothetical protein CDV31_000006 [Fusarium ambrosium]|uniref:Uncharacterized protein n=1 Tax=Fusarium ambrosium TaxID=131363 RepID=A0A428V357_9HYPO|nr:hypothetical protein CDV31_000006 [Fusarium ambrosium]
MADQDPEFTRPGFFPEPFIDPEPVKSPSEDVSEGEKSPDVLPETSADLPVVTNPLAREPIRPEAMCTRTTSTIPADWEMGGSLATASDLVGNMYFEQLTPPEVLHPWPVILIHGDFHTGQV